MQPALRRRVAWCRLLAGIAQGGGRMVAGKSFRASKSSAQYGWAAGLLACGVALAALWHFSTRDAPSPIVAQSVVVVLPLHAAGANTPEQTLLAEQLSRDVATQLARVDGLHVIGVVSAARAQAEKFDLAQLSERLRANRVLEGSLRQADDHLLVELRLSSVPEGRTIWAQAYTRERGEWFDLQRNIAHSVAEALELRYQPAAAEHASVDPQRLLGYLAARRQLDGGDHARAEQALRDMVAAAPQFAPAQATLARMLVADLRRGEPGTDQLEEIARAARQALALDPSLADAHMATAVLACRAADWTMCLASFRAALAQQPLDTDCRVTYAYWLAGLGYVEPALREVEAAWAADPLSYDANFARGRLLDTLGRHDEAKEFFDTAMPPTAGLVYARWHNALWRGDIAAARDYATAMPQSDGFRESYIGITEAFAEPSRWAQVQPMIGTSERATGRINVLRIMVPDADYPVEIEGLERMLRNGWPSYYLLLWMPEYRALRAHPSFAAFVQRTQMLPYWRIAGFPPQCRANGESVQCD
jgi:TolB-like protein/Tfp pilus assembly protein PilF